MSQSRIVAIMFVIGVTMIAAVIYVRDMLVFNHGVSALQECERSIALGDGTRELQSKLGSESCASLVKVDVPRANGKFRLHAHRTTFHDNWHIVVETNADAVTAIRYHSRKQLEGHPKGAPPDRFTAR
jgi:hypothetical protein